jgi:hypothetical protein
LTDGPPRALLIAALVVAVGAVAAVLAIAATRQPAVEPVAIAAVPAPHAGDPPCHALMDALPQRLGDYDRAPTADPTPAGTAAWRSNADPDPVILRCGVDRPDDFVVGSSLQVVDDVQWFQVKDPAVDRSTWFAVDRPVYVALTLPQGSGPTPIQELSELIGRTIAAVPISPGPPR